MKHREISSSLEKYQSSDFFLSNKNNTTHNIVTTEAPLEEDSVGSKATGEESNQTKKKEMVKS